jgi:hypothetical protein
MRNAVLAFSALALVAGSSPSLGANQCRDLKGKFIRCPEKAAKPIRCKDAKGKFAKCGTPGAKPVK